MEDMILFFRELAEHEEQTGDPEFSEQIEGFVEKMEDGELKTPEDAALYFYELYNTMKD